MLLISGTPRRCKDRARGATATAISDSDGKTDTGATATAISDSDGKTDTGATARADSDRDRDAGRQRDGGEGDRVDGYQLSA